MQDCNRNICNSCDISETRSLHL